MSIAEYSGHHHRTADGRHAHDMVYTKYFQTRARTGLCSGSCCIIDVGYRHKEQPEGFMAGQAMHRCQQKALGRALECWYEHHVQLLMQYHQSSRILMRRTSGAKAVAWLTWHQAYATARSCSFRARKVLVRWKHNRYVKAFGTWQVLTNA